MEVIDGQLNMSITLSTGAVGYASLGGVIEDGALDDAIITQAMLVAYQDALASVNAYDYSVATTAQELFQQEAAANLDSLNIAIDNLSDATSAIMLATSVMEIASQADTRPEQVALQNMLSTEEYTVSAAEVDSYNTSLAAVENYAQQAGAFMAAANNAELTASIDSYAAQGGFIIGSYTAISYTQSIDEFLINWDDAGYASGWNNYLTNDMKTAADVYGAGQYIQEYGTNVGVN